METQRSTINRIRKKIASVCVTHEEKMRTFLFFFSPFCLRQSFFIKNIKMFSRRL